ncbi:MAG: flagellar hook capping FlgD N-terminal domain-containing protein [Verrucomicrobiia bacterium]
MNTNAISQVSGISTPSDTADRIPSKTLTQEDFLKLLVAQLKTQDPLNPMKDTEFIGQMVQFSVLEQNKTMQTTMASMNSAQQIIQANSMLGRIVQVQEEDGTISSGAVSSIVFDQNTPLIMVNGKAYQLNQVLSVEPGETTTINK